MAIALLFASLLWTIHPQAMCLLGPIPDNRCSPGDVDPITVAIVCGTSTRARRRVTASMRKAVLSEYGIAWEDRGAWIVDHRVPLEAGGSNSLLNTWPMTVEAATKKDAIEGAVHRRICSGRMTLPEAAAFFEGDWTRAIP